jgi:hypothetical protein
MSTKDEQVKKVDAIQRNQLVTIEDLATFKIELLKDIKELLSVVVQQPGKKWIKSAEVRKLLNISPGTLQTLRVNGTLPFQKVGGAMYYKWEDIEKMMNKDDSDP